EAAIAALKEWDEYVTAGIQSVEEYANVHDTTIGLFEWSALEKCALDDPDTYLQANPSIGFGYEVEALLSDLESGEPESVTRTEVLCQWVESTVEPFMDPKWTELTDAPRVNKRGMAHSDEVGGCGFGEVGGCGFGDRPHEGGSKIV